MEARVPLAQDQAFAESLSFDTAYRYSDYGDGVQTDTYKFGLEWAPIADVRLRGTYQRAVRAANIVELFTAQGFNLFDATGDPCGAAARDPEASVQECVDSGVPLANVGVGCPRQPGGSVPVPPGRQRGPDSGNVGYLLVRHRVAAALGAGSAITVDYFDIKIDDTITTFGSPNTWTACYANNDPAACDRINRNPNGQLWIGQGHVVDTNINIGSLSTTGYDVNIAYTGVEIGRFGSLSFNMTGTYVVDLITQPAPGDRPPSEPEQVQRYVRLRWLLFVRCA